MKKTNYHRTWASIAALDDDFSFDMKSHFTSLTPPTPDQNDGARFRRSSLEDNIFPPPSAPKGIVPTAHPSLKPPVNGDEVGVAREGSAPAKIHVLPRKTKWRLDRSMSMNIPVSFRNDVSMQDDSNQGGLRKTCVIGG